MEINDPLKFLDNDIKILVQGYFEGKGIYPIAKTFHQTLPVVPEPGTVRSHFWDRRVVQHRPLCLFHIPHYHHHFNPCTMKKNKQSGASTRWNSFHKNYSLLVPIQFAMLCDLLDLKIEDVLYDFMAAAGQESYSKGRKPEKSILKYFLQSGYGQGHYTRTDIRKIFREFKAISELWPRSAETDIIARHSTWRDMYYQYLHSKWFHKIRRKSPDGKEAK